MSIHPPAPSETPRWRGGLNTSAMVFARLSLAYAAAVASTAVSMGIFLVWRQATKPLVPHTIHALAKDFLEVVALFGIFTALLAILPFFVAELLLRLTGRRALAFHALAGAMTGACMIPFFLGMLGSGPASADALAAAILAPILLGTASATVFRLVDIRLAREAPPAAAWRRPSRWLLAACLAVTAFEVTEETVFDPTRHPPRALFITIDGTVETFMARNHIVDRPREEDVPYSIDLDRTPDISSLSFLAWTTVTVDAGAASVDLPPADEVYVSQEAGRIRDVDMHLRRPRRSLAEARATIEAIRARMLAKGWRDPEASRAQFAPDAGAGAAAMAGVSLRSPDGLKAQITIDDLSGGDEGGDRYGLSIEIDEPDRPLDSYEETVDPRRLFTAGTARGALPLRAWVEDPDWSPQAHGMIRQPAPVAEHPDRTIWVMPPKTAPR